MHRVILSHIGMGIIWKNGNYSNGLYRSSGFRDTSSGSACYEDMVLGCFRLRNISASDCRIAQGAFRYLGSCDIAAAVLLCVSGTLLQAHSHLGLDALS